MDPFEGTWRDKDGTLITVKREGPVVTLTYSNGRGPFQGLLPRIYPPAIQVVFSDVGENLMGRLENNQIVWSNNTTWTRVGDAA